MDYYYIVASLPHIEFGSVPPIGKEDFLRNCRGILGQDEVRAVEAVLGGHIGECDNGFACELVNAEIQMRNAIAKIRGQKKGVDPRQYIRDHSGYNGWIDKLVTDAFVRDNPRERVLGLDHARWRIADELAGPEPFSFGRVLAFAVKLRIATRWHELDKEEGAARVEEFIEEQTRDENSEEH